MEDKHLHKAASRIFARITKASDAKSAGSGYAEFFYQFSLAFRKRMDEIIAGDEEYRYPSLLEEASPQPAKPPPTEREAPRTADDAPDDTSEGRTF